MTPANVLVVEDERLVALSMQRKLESLGYHVPVTVATGEEAIRQAERVEPDLILMDIMLAGGIDGITAASAIRENHNIPIIYLTAYSDDDTLRRARLTEPFGYLLKPFEGKELQTAIEMALYKHQMDRRLKEKEHWLATVLNSIGDAVIATDEQSQITFMNPVAETLTGWVDAEAVGQPLAEVFQAVAEDTRQSVLNEVEAVFHSNISTNLADVLLRDREGIERPIEESIAPIQDDEGNSIGTVLVFRDISERRRIDKSLRESEEKYRLLFENSPESITLIGLDGTILDCNPATLRLRDAPKEDIIGQQFIDIGALQVEDLEHYMQLFSQLIQGETINSIHVEIRGPQDDPRWLEVFPVLLKQDDEIFAIQAISRDITERKLAEDELHRYQENLEDLVADRTAALEVMNGELQREITERELAQEIMMHQTQQLAQSNAELEQFAYVASHDLREPLRKIKSYTELLAKRYDGQLDERADKYIFYIVDGATRMQQLIADLLTYSRAGRAELVLEEVPFTAVVDKALNDLELAIRESEAKITWDEMPTLSLDVQQMTRVLQNLIGNAIKFRGEKVPEVHISSQQQGDEWHFVVSDNGIGIDPQYLERVFLIFQRLHTRTDYPGTGIGLAVCKKIVENHNGRIWAESEPDQGTTFHFTLPLRKADH